MDSEIVQASCPKRTSLNGLDRIFSPPIFDGKVLPERNYILLDDTITQGRTFAALAQHIERNGGFVTAIIALTGKRYSCRLSPDEADILDVRSIFGDIKNEFKCITGYGFNRLTKSESRYLANFRTPDTIRNKILAYAYPAAHRDIEGHISESRIRLRKNSPRL